MRQALTWAVIMIVVVAMMQALMVNSAVIIFANGIGTSLIAISLVLLTGYAGEINLAAFSFAGVAAIVAWQFDVGPGGQATTTSLSLGAIVLAVVVCAAVGALIALPALRLRGLYLALATFAFAVVVDVMVIRQTAPITIRFWFIDTELNLFSTGTLTMPRPHWFGIDFLASQRNYLMLMTVVFVLIAIGLVALRRSSYGRMIVAMRDSPAACATLGLNITRLKLAVFTLSSAIAGLGGLMWAVQQRNITNQGTFQVFASLTLFMIAVAAGIGYISGALLAGLMLSVLQVVIPNIFTKLATDYPSLEWLFDDLHNFVKYLGPALIGIGLAKNPSGIVSDIMEGFRVLRKAPIGVAIWVAVEVGLWFLAWREVIGNWTFVLITIALAFIAPRVIIGIWHDEVEGDLPDAHVEDDDLAGLTRAFTASDRDRYDAILGLDGGVR
jgi:ABC-type branched-subunit amino acid transport system permease subunit